ncbi:MAG: hypothetical protein IAG13_15825 [Deltaproteobacteria bacterium]|nr:hypothetical protein [Nannocystaceae bacterium]
MPETGGGRSVDVVVPDAATAATCVADAWPPSSRRYATWQAVFAAENAVSDDELVVSNVVFSCLASPAYCASIRSARVLDYEPIFTEADSLRADYRAALEVEGEVLVLPPVTLPRAAHYSEAHATILPPYLLITQPFDPRLALRAGEEEEDEADFCTRVFTVTSLDLVAEWNCDEVYRFEPPVIHGTTPSDVPTRCRAEGTSAVRVPAATRLVPLEGRTACWRGDARSSGPCLAVLHTPGGPRLVLAASEDGKLIHSAPIAVFSDTTDPRLVAKLPPYLFIDIDDTSTALDDPSCVAVVDAASLAVLADCLDMGAGDDDGIGSPIAEGPSPPPRSSGTRSPISSRP